jgi:release factor glutamine methyltransferase
VSATLRDLVLAARARLAAAGIETNEAALDAALLARHVLGWDLAQFVARQIDSAPEGFQDAFEPIVFRRERREPMSAITRRREFWGLEFEVGPEVLAPRPETEIVVEEALACLVRAGRDDDGRPSLVDVGTGSGCLAVCLATEFPVVRVIATDISPAAISIATRNARRHGVGDRVEFRQTSLLDGVAGPAALIVSNPPYIPSDDISGLPPEVRVWEPLQALDGGPDGLDVVRALLADAPRVLAPGGWLIMEFGYGQRDGVTALLRGSRLELVRVLNDLQQIPRTLVARMPGVVASG